MTDYNLSYIDDDTFNVKLSENSEYIMYEPVQLYYPRMTLDDFDVYTLNFKFKSDSSSDNGTAFNDVPYKIAIKHNLNHLRHLLCDLIGSSQILLSYEDEETLETQFYGAYYYFYHKFDKNRKTLESIDPHDLINSLIKTFELNRNKDDELLKDKINSLIEMLSKEILEKFYKDSVKKFKHEFLSNCYDYYVWCYYKDLDGIYCEDCKRWLVKKYIGTDLDEKNYDRDYYIVSDDLEACPDCVKVRDGQYEYLSHFTIIENKFKEACGWDKQEILDYLRTPFLKKFGRERGHEIKKYTWKEVSEEPDLVLCDEDYAIILRQKHKNKDLFKTKIDPNEIVGYSVWYNLSRREIKLYQAREQIFQDKPMLRYIIVKKFGNKKDKISLYKKYKNKYNIFESREKFTIKDFYNVRGYELLNDYFNSIVKHPVIEDDWDKNDRESWWASLDTSKDVYYRLQQSYFYQL